MPRNRPKPLLRILESGFLTIGAVLLVSFFVLRGWGDYAAWSDISAFEEAVASGPAATGQATVAGTRYSPEPDYTLWAEKRISDYHRGNALRDEAPLAILTISNLDLKVRSQAQIYQIRDPR